MSARRKPIKGKTAIIHHDDRTVFSFISPSYDETTLFLIALTCLLLIFKDNAFGHAWAFVFAPSDMFVEYTKRDPRWVFFIWLIIVVVGFVLSIFHALIKKEKSPFEKTTMAVFALTVNGFAGIYSGVDLLSRSARGALIFPIMNILSGMFLMYQLGVNTEGIIRDEDANFWEVLPGSVILISVYIFCQKYLILNWAGTFSICVTYSTLFHQALVRLYHYIISAVVK